MLTLTINKENKDYVVEYLSKKEKGVLWLSKDSLFESIYKLGRNIHLNDVHFRITKDLRLPLLSFLSIEYPGELYEHKITIMD
ncbi:hypothetical protein M3603_06865 [Rummeliibacillus stabekisii]|uniref:Uncharacterized protein n=1 Tax=Rummeliibacillus stabekisii TaxID=241244 RepID=A0A143HCI3_9BACL|nr:hypothetical protein [Rummeliibacillus stabekisii]AMW98981.1 hypothetical protein ATY39_05625 [Rummeliibacillus stabekisii]MCM3316398.1 hypothetical protein [Rummeliibacillus stabekisii]